MKSNRKTTLLLCIKVDSKYAMNYLYGSIAHVETAKRKAVILFKKIQASDPIPNMGGNYGNRCVITIFCPGMCTFWK